VRGCDAGISAGLKDYSRYFQSRTPVASARMILRAIAQACRARFPAWAEAAEPGSRVGRAERSRILGRALVDVCPGAETATMAADLVAACPMPHHVDGTLPVWKRLDAGTYALVYALARAGVTSTALSELILQASLTPEFDK
jgi:hypothetical protein